MKVSNERHARCEMVDTARCAANMKARIRGAMKPAPERKAAPRRRDRIRPSFAQWLYLIAGLVLVGIGVLHLLGLRT